MSFFEKLIQDLIENRYENAEKRFAPLKTMPFFCYSLKMASLHRGNTIQTLCLKRDINLKAVGVYIFDDFLLLSCGQDCSVTCAGLHDTPM